MLRSAGFRILMHPEDEVYLCRIAEPAMPQAAVYPARGASAERHAPSEREVPVP